MLDQVINWNNVCLQLIRDNGGAPGPISRTGAILHASILRNFFDTDNVTFTATTEDPSARGNNGIRITRTFNSFSAAALENGRSRVYLGVHFQWDADAAYVSGTRLADFIYENLLACN